MDATIPPSSAACCHLYKPCFRDLHYQATTQIFCEFASTILQLEVISEFHYITKCHLDITVNFTHYVYTICDTSAAMTSRAQTSNTEVLKSLYLCLVGIRKLFPETVLSLSSSTGALDTVQTLTPFRYQLNFLRQDILFRSTKRFSTCR